MTIKSNNKDRNFKMEANLRFVLQLINNSNLKIINKSLLIKSVLYSVKPTTIPAKYTEIIQMPKGVQ